MKEIAGELSLGEIKSALSGEYNLDYYVGVVEEVVVKRLKAAGANELVEEYKLTEGALQTLIGRELGKRVIEELKGPENLPQLMKIYRDAPLEEIKRHIETIVSELANENLQKNFWSIIPDGLERSKHFSVTAKHIG